MTDKNEPDTSWWVARCQEKDWEIRKLQEERTELRHRVDELEQSLKLSRRAQQRAAREEEAQRKATQFESMTNRQITAALRLIASAKKVKEARKLAQEALDYVESCRITAAERASLRARESILLKIWIEHDLGEEENALMTEFFRTHMDTLHPDTQNAVREALGRTGGRR